ARARAHRPTPSFPTRRSSDLFDRLILATGASPRPLDVPGADAAGVRMLRTIDDADGLRADLLGGGRRVVLIGSGWIGLELAAARSEEHTSELQSRENLVCRLL